MDGTLTWIACRLNETRLSKCARYKECVMNAFQYIISSMLRFEHLRMHSLHSKCQMYSKVWKDQKFCASGPKGSLLILIHDDDVVKLNHFSTYLLTLCERHSPVTGGFPSRRPVTRSFDVFFDLHLNKRLTKQTIDTPVIWDGIDHYDITVMLRW